MVKVQAFRFQERLANPLTRRYVGLPEAIAPPAYA
jgi:hypothetical protein